MKIKLCNNCKILKPINEFYIDKDKSDGHTTNCRECKIKYWNKYYKKHKYKHLNACWDRLKKLRKTKKGHKQLKAGQDFRNAIQAGKIKKINNCSFCGKSPAEGHHKDYNKPFDVVWVCSRCHKVLHQKSNRRI